VRHPLLTYLEQINKKRKNANFATKNKHERMSKSNKIETTEFQQVQGIISLHRSKALQTVNNENLLIAWEVGAFVSTRLTKLCVGKQNS